MKAVWKGVVLAESDNVKVIEGHHYFPPDSVNKEYFTRSEKNSECPWKGVASYYNIVVDGEQLKDAAWYYPCPKEDARNIKNYVAFAKGVEVKE